MHAAALVVNSRRPPRYGIRFLILFTSVFVCVYYGKSRHLKVGLIFTSLHDFVIQIA
jgi:hypothetical protein